MTTYRFTFGRCFDQGASDELTAQQAVELAKKLPGPGTVWMKLRDHHTIVGNYAAGKAWNGQEQRVEATAEDWVWIAHNRT